MIVHRFNGVSDGPAGSDAFVRFEEVAIDGGSVFDFCELPLESVVDTEVVTSITCSEHLAELFGRGLILCIAFADSSDALDLLLGLSLVFVGYRRTPAGITSPQWGHMSSSGSLGTGCVSDWIRLRTSVIIVREGTQTTKVYRGQVDLREKLAKRTVSQTVLSYLTRTCVWR